VSTEDNKAGKGIEKLGREGTGDSRGADENAKEKQTG